jgi:uncharacterized membrane protein YecN with MAPEG domain
MPEFAIPITTLLTSGLALWLLMLTVIVVKARQVSGQSLGDGGDVPLTRAIRAQANLTEFAPVFIALIFIGELQNGNSYLLGALAITFMIARLAHGYALALSQNNAPARAGGFLFTVIPIGISAIYNLYTAHFKTRTF